MSWRPAALFTILLAVLLPFYLGYDRNYAHSLIAQQEKANLLNIDVVQSMKVVRGDESVAFTKTSDGKLYQVISPSGVFIPQDLLAATTALLVKSREVDVVVDKTDDLAQYGLDHPKAEMEVHASNRPEAIHIVLGNENPTHTAIYAKMPDSPKVFLLGLDLKYYEELMFEWIEGKQGKKAS